MGHFSPPGSGSGYSNLYQCGSMRIRIHNPAKVGLVAREWSKNWGLQTIIGPPAVPRVPGALLPGSFWQKKREVMLHCAPSPYSKKWRSLSLMERSWTIPTSCRKLDNIRGLEFEFEF